jgi:threonyl-tRNA synthetase
MNCPGHILIFKQGIKSYRDLPLRYGEFGQCHRNEPIGGLHGIMRVRGFTQDDGHIFCTENQILSECVDYTALCCKRCTPTLASRTSSTRSPPDLKNALVQTKVGTEAEAALMES